MIQRLTAKAVARLCLHAIASSERLAGATGSRESLACLLPGMHTIRKVVPDGIVQSFPDDGAHSVTLLSGQSVQDIDFGNIRLAFT